MALPHTVQFVEKLDTSQKRRIIAIEGRIDFLQRFVIEYLPRLNTTRALKAVVRLIYTKLPPADQAVLLKHGYPYQTPVSAPARATDGNALIDAAYILVEAGQYPNIGAALQALIGSHAPASRSRVG